MNESTYPTPSAIGKLLDMLIKHGTLPNMPVPDLIVNAQVELASLEIRTHLLERENDRLREVGRKFSEWDKEHGHSLRYPPAELWGELAALLGPKP